MADPVPQRPFVLAIDPREPPLGLQGAVYAVGNFDGIHRGHKAVIERARAMARALDVPCGLLTFEPHPSDYFGGSGTIFRLTPMEEKARLSARLGLDGMVVLPFDRAMAALPAERFVADILIGRLGIVGIVAGYDFHFGAKRVGTPDFLRAAGAAADFEVEIVAKVQADALGAISTASSTATRTALEMGDVERASLLLGHPFAIGGVVLPGQRLGRTLGFPTANIQADPSCRLRHGIYAVRAEVDGVLHDGVASYGRRPTVDNGAPLLETFLFGFSDDLYGKVMDVAFVAWLRPEERFETLEALTRQMRIDASQAAAALAAHPSSEAAFSDLPRTP